MNNVKLMTKVIELDTQTLNTREQSRRVMIQIAIIRKAFGVKNSETDSRVLDYERVQVLTNEEIEKEFNEYVGFWNWAIRSKNTDKAKTYENDVFYLIDGVRFFNETLADTFKKSFIENLKQTVLS